MLKLTATIDLSDVNRMFDQIREEHPKAIVRALNKTATTARAQAAREILGAGYGMKISAIKKAINIRRASNSELTAILRATGKPFPLISYSASQTKAGVSVAVLHGRKVIKGAFIATMKSGHKGVFVRVGSAAERSISRGGRFKIGKGKAIRSKTHGLPIRELFGPGVPQAFVNQTVQAALVSIVRERFAVVLEQELKFIKL